MSDEVVVPPFVRNLRNSPGLSDDEFESERLCRIWRYPYKDRWCAVPIVWKRILSYPGMRLDAPDSALVMVDCIGLLWGQFIENKDHVVTVRFTVPLGQYKTLQLAMVEV